MVSTKPTIAKILILRVQFRGLRLDNNDVFFVSETIVGLLKSRLYELRDAELDEAPSSMGPGSGRWWYWSWCLCWRWWSGVPAAAPWWESMIAGGVVNCGFVFGTGSRVKVVHLHGGENVRTRRCPGVWDLNQVTGVGD